MATGSKLPDPDASKWGCELDVATLTSRAYLHHLADILEGEGEAGLTEYLEKVLRESGVALKRQDADRARKAAVRVVREREAGRRKDADVQRLRFKEEREKAKAHSEEAEKSRREAEKAERIRLKEAAAADKKRRAEEEAQRERRREAEVQTLLARLGEDVALVGDMLDMAGLAAVVGSELEAAVAGYRVPGTWRLASWPDGLTRATVGRGNELVTIVRDCAMAVVPVGKVWEEERNRLRYRVAYQLPDRRWRSVDLLPTFTAKDLVRAGLPVIDSDSQKATMKYLAAFIETNALYEVTDTDATDAVEYLVSWIRENYRHFSGGDKKVLGRFTRILDEAAILVSRATLHSVLDRAGYCPAKVISSWRAKGFLIITSDGRSCHRQTLGGEIREGCIALRRKAIDPEFVDWVVNEGVIRWAMRPDGAPREKVTTGKLYLREPRQVDITLVPVTADGEIDPAREQTVVERIIPGSFKGDQENTLAAASDMAQAILANPFRPNEERRIIEVKGQHWLMKDRCPWHQAGPDTAREVAREAAGGGSLVGGGASRAGRGGGKNSVGDAQAWAAAKNGT